MCPRAFHRWRLPDSVSGITLALLFALIISCGADSTPPKRHSSETTSRGPIPKDQDSPTSVLQKAQFALWQNDREKFTECYLTPPKGEEFLDAVYDAMVSEYNFLTKIKEVYGQNGLDYFQDIATGKAGMHTFIAPSVGSEWWEARIVKRIQINGDDARYYDPILKKECSMIRLDNVWRIRLEVPDSADWDMAYCKMIAEVARVTVRDIGKSDVTIDDIRLRLGKLEREGSDKLGPRVKH